MKLILHGINLKCGKKCRNGYIGIMDAVLFLCLCENWGKQVVQNEQTVRECHLQERCLIWGEKTWDLS
jgi:hypothetical protein